jgi:crotonobetainyl-CoA:carnitine CoA-transferase CaiB-like acyl-CoA transferase
MPPELNGESTYFLCANRSKRSVAIDLKHPDGRALAQSLADQADVLVENFRLGALDRLGLGYEELRARNPGLIYCSISGYGRTGPRAAEPGYDFAIQAESGLMSITGEPDGMPMKLGVAVTDIVTGMNGVQAILAALLARGRTGRGQHIDLSLLDGAVAMLANIATGHLATGQEPRRFGNAHPTVVPYQLVPSQDGVVALAVGNDLQFRNMCEQVLKRPDLAADERFRTMRGRVLHREVLIAEISAAFATAPTAHWMDLLRRAGVPAGEVRSVAEALASPEIAARGLVAEVADPRHGALRLLRSPLGLTGTPPRDPAPPPRLGEHTGDILRDVLGLDEARIAELGAAGAISQNPLGAAS